MLLIDEMLKSIKPGGLGLCVVHNGGASFVGPVATKDDAERLSRKIGGAYPNNNPPEFVLHQRNFFTGWGAGTKVVARFDRSGRRIV